MGVWMELRCDAMLPDCESGRNTGPMTLVKQTRVAVNVALARLERQAKEAGWRRTKDGILCPQCKDAA